MELNTNDVYLYVDNYDIHGLMTKVSIAAKVDSIDVTTGGDTHVRRQAGIKDVTGSFTITYRVDQVNEYVAKLAPGKIVNLDYGSEKAVAGKPRHKQDILVTEVSHEITADKQLVVFEVSWEGAGVPEYDMYNGATF